MCQRVPTTAPTFQAGDGWRALSAASSRRRCAPQRPTGRARAPHTLTWGVGSQRALSLRAARASSGEPFPKVRL